MQPFLDADQAGCRSLLHPELESSALSSLKQADIENYLPEEADIENYCHKKADIENYLT